MPTPTVVPSSGPIDGVETVVGVTVVNVAAPSPPRRRRCGRRRSACSWCRRRAGSPASRPRRRVLRRVRDRTGHRRARRRRPPSPRRARRRSTAISSGSTGETSAAPSAGASGHRGGRLRRSAPARPPRAGPRVVPTAAGEEQQRPRGEHCRRPSHRSDPLTELTRDSGAGRRVRPVSTFGRRGRWVPGATSVTPAAPAGRPVALVSFSLVARTPGRHAPLAQLAEQLTLNQRVRGSSP